MDSATQFVLGACVSGVLLGPGIGPRKAVILGGVLGTVPDLDVFYPFEDAVDSFTLHRGASHSLLVHVLVAPLVGEGILRAAKGFQDMKASSQRWLVYGAVFLIFATHALLDALTIYGTRLFWPLIDTPYGVGSLFIMDPFYTIPLMVLTVWGLFLSRWRAGYQKGLSIALVITTLYIGWSLGAQKWALSRAETALGGWQEEDHITVTPVPLTTFFWKVLVVRADSYANLYVPLFGEIEDIRAYAYPRNIKVLGCALKIPKAAQIADFSNGFFRLDTVEGRIRMSDLRMGLTPDYVFRFDLAELTSDGIQVIPAIQAEEGRSEDMEADLHWLGQGIRGTGILRPLEAGHVLSLPETGPLHKPVSSPSKC